MKIRKIIASSFFFINWTRKASDSLLFSRTEGLLSSLLGTRRTLYKSVYISLRMRFSQSTFRDSLARMPSVNVKHTANITCGSRPLPSTLNLERIANLMGKLPRDTHAVVHPSRRIEDHEVAPERGTLNGIIWVCGTQGLRISSSLAVFGSQSPMPPAIAISSLWSDVTTCVARLTSAALRSTRRIFVSFPVGVKIPSRRRESRDKEHTWEYKFIINYTFVIILYSPEYSSNIAATLQGYCYIAGIF